MNEICDGTIYSGASGIVLPVPNKLFYPPEFQDKPRLSYYASLFNSIEINSSFYKLPNAPTLKKWADSVPDNFRFTFKLWKQITHNKELVFSPDDIYVFFDRISAVGDKKGCLLVQFPPGLSAAYANQFENLLQTLKNANAGSSWVIAVEFRNRSWYQDEIFELLDSFGAIVVIQDLPASATPIPDELSSTVYVRFHGPDGGYRGSYSDEFLSEYSTYLTDWKAEGKTVYVYFNNTMGAAAQNLVSLNRLLGVH